MLAMATTFFVSCVDDNKDTEAPFLKVSHTTLYFNLDGQPTQESQASFEISTNRNWTITVQDNKTWVTLSKYEGEGSKTIQVSIPEGINDEARLVIAISNKVGVLMSETVTIKSGNIVPSIVIYHETVGTGTATSPYPYVDVYKDWNTTGTGITNVTYSGKNATVRNSGLANTNAYEGASGPNIVFFGVLPNEFVINKIALTAGQTNLKLTFGGSYSFKPEGATEYDNIFDISKFKVSLSANGTTWIPLTYTKNNGDAATPYWIFATADFTLKQAVSELYIKYTAEAASAFRLDDITLATGNGGQEIELSGGSAPSEAQAITIPELIAMMGATQQPIDSNADRYFEAIVQCDVAGGNYTTNTLPVAIENATVPGSGLSLYGSQVDPKTIGVTRGDRIRVTLHKSISKVVNYKGLYEITGAKTDNWATIEKISTTTITPVIITADKLIEYQGMSVTIKNATPSGTGIWNTGIHTFMAGGKDFSVFCGTGATDFIDKPFAMTQGDITGVVTVYDNNGQLAPRTMNDVQAFNPTTPTITSVNPTSVNIPATGGTQAIEVVVVNQGSNTLSTNGLSGILSATVSNTTVTVTATANSTTAIVEQTLVIALANGNSIEVPVKVAAAGTNFDTKGTFESMAPFKFTSVTDVVNAYSLALIVNDLPEINNELKIGTSKLSGVFTSGAIEVTGNKKLSFYAGAWTKETMTVYIRVNGGGSISGENSVVVGANAGATGTGTFKVTFSDPDYYTFNLTGLTATSTITFATDANFNGAGAKARGILCGIQLY